MKPDHSAAFREEARELLVELEASLLELEEFPGDVEAVGRVFRALHTIKGSGAMFGFDAVAAFTHEVETAFDLVRGGKIPVSKELVGITLSSGDHIRSLLEASGTESGACEARGSEIIDALRKLVSNQCTESLQPLSTESPLENCAHPDAQSAGASSTAAEESRGEGDGVTCRIRFRPHSSILATGSNPILLLNELRELGTCTIVAMTETIPSIEEIDPEACYTFWDIILTTGGGVDAVRDVFIFVEDECELSIEVIDEPAALDEGVVAEAVRKDHKKLGEILVERGDLDRGTLDKTLGSQKRLGEMLVESGVIDPGRIESALAEQQHLKAVRKERQTVESAATIRVPAERLDALMNLIGELVTVQARLSQTASRRDDPEVLAIAEEVERLTVELRDNTMNIRMVPIGTTFSKFKRLVRDLSQGLGKEVVLTTDGAETELDKTVIERLNDPLVHLIRNSIDHGIEAPKVRTSAGKPREGKVHLSALHSGAHVLISIRDDGAGLDREAIRARAVEHGVIAPEAMVSEKDLFALIFTPGFSTSRAVTNVSGRGVGMDVVKRGIDALRGTIEIQSRKGIGTTINLKLPLTLAIIDGLLVKLAQSFFVLPLSIVEECVELTREEVTKAHGRRMAHVRGELIPYIRLRECFGISGEAPVIEQIVIIEAAACRVGLVVDQVVGEHQTVIKNLGRMYRNVEGISGATILGDGTVALIMDADKLVRKIETEEYKEYRIN